VTARLAAPLAAEKQAEALFDTIETTGMIAPGRSERAVEQAMPWAVSAAR